MGIENLLAQGVQIRPAGMERNALMQYQQFKDGQQRNALMQMQLQDVHAQRQLAIQQAQQQSAQQAEQAAWRRTLPQPQGDPRLQALRGGVDVGAVSPMDFLKEAYPAQPAPKTHVVGGALVETGPGGVKELYKQADKEPEEVRLLKQVYGDGTPAYQQALRMLAQKKTTHAPAAQITNHGSPVPVQLPDGSIGYVQPTNRGGPVAPMTTPGGDPLRKPADQKDKDLTEGQAKATTYLGQMRSATQALEALKMDQSALSTQAETALAGGVVNVAIGAKAQQVRQSQDQWSEAFLRFKTGAASTKDEVAANRKTFFPSIGDKTDAVAQKKTMRAQAERDMEIAAGRGAKQLSQNPNVAAQPGMPEMSAIDAEIARRRGGK